MQGVAAILALLASGCSLFLGGDNQQPAQSDGSVDATADASAACSAPEIEVLQLISDSEISDGGGQNIMAGGFKALRLRMESPTSHSMALLRFRNLDRTDGFELLGMTLRWQAMTSSMSACGAGGAQCNDCVMNFMDGGIASRFLTNEWLETDVTWNQATSGKAWDPDLFETDGNASRVIASTPFGVSDLEVELEINAEVLAGELETWRDGDEVSLVIQAADATASVMFATREMDETCDGGGRFGAAQLVVEYCSE